MWQKEEAEMTREEKIKIQSLRAEGMKYAQIAEHTGLSINTVKSFCRRNEISAETEVEQDDGKTFCQYCGRLIVQVLKQKPKKFCNDACRMKWWNSHPELVHRGRDYRFKCKYCGKDFISRGSRNRKYCSRDCYISNRYGGAGDDS